MLCSHLIETILDGSSLHGFGLRQSWVLKTFLSLPKAYTVQANNMICEMVVLILHAVHFHNSSNRL